MPEPRMMYGRSPSGLTTDPSIHPWEPECDDLGCVEEPRDPTTMRSDDLRRHMRDLHHMDPDYLRNVPDASLRMEHQWSHEDGLDIEPHDHQEATDD